MTWNGRKYELVPSGTHHRNLAEKGIQTFKGHFKSVLCGVDGLLPLNLWDRLIPQTEMQVNLLRYANATPKVSEYVYINGTHDLNRIPMTKLGCAIQIHNNPDQRAPWAPQYINGWYLITLTGHYHCYNVWIRETGAKNNVIHSIFQAQVYNKSNSDT